MEDTPQGSCGEGPEGAASSTTATSAGSISVAMFFGFNKSYLQAAGIFFSSSAAYLCHLTIRLVTTNAPWTTEQIRERENTLNELVSED
jgi:hypothetical protein